MASSPKRDPRYPSTSKQPAQPNASPAGTPESSIAGRSKWQKTPSPQKYKSSPRAPSSWGNVRSPPGWRHWPELVVRVNGLPLSTTTGMIWEWLSPQGEIVWIDVFSPQEGCEEMSAKIKFCPPPEAPFWEHGPLPFSHRDMARNPSVYSLQVFPLRDAPKGWHSSKISRDWQYPLNIKLALRSLEFGSMLLPNAMNVVNSLASSSELGHLRMELDFRKKQLIVFFTVPQAQSSGTGVREFKFIVDIAHMKDIHRVLGDDGACALILPLPFPPQYFWKNPDALATFFADTPTWSNQDTWYRATNVTEDPEASLAFPVAIHNDISDPGYIDIGRLTTFRLLLADSEKAKVARQHLEMALQDLNIVIQQDNDFEVRREVENMWRHIDHPPVVAKGLATALLAMPTSPVIHLTFEVRYQLEVCVSRGVLNEHSVCAEFLERLAALDPFEATRRLEYLVDKGQRIHNPVGFFAASGAEAYLPIVRIPHYCTLVRKASITPTTIRFNSPAVETSNRVIRKYNHIQDRFLRVQFVEETERGKITKNKSQNDDVWKRVYRTLYQGIQIGDRRYEFLAFGSSQLRQFGAYFYCPTDHTSCDDIRQWMGQFNHIRIVAKYAARLGQCFSTTREIRGIPVPMIRPIPDIERNGHCFTDGVGVISPFLARIVIEEMTLDVFDEPSAFQFRMGGCKGVLAVWPHAKGMEVHIRKSQEKFNANFKGLEIIRCAKFCTATLNRQTVTILECLGVPIEVFVRLLTQQTHLYEKALTNNSAAIQLLTKFVDENQTTLVLAELLKAGFKTDDVQEPFVMNLLNLWRSWSLKLLKEKARIHVEKSAFVLGCVDETGTLRGHSIATEGSKDDDVNKLPQIFLQLSDPKYYDQKVIVKGICIVGRNPSLHAGDIRVVQAVDNPKLHHLKDVVVFSSKGDRPVPNMLSGGDLDGDDFFVIWDPEMIPKEWNHPPMNYDAPKPRQLNRDVDVDDLRDFFVKYMRNDVLGLIATAHLGFADERGPKSAECRRLAELHSQAVDYPKTGEPAEFNTRLQPKRWPHFMEKRSNYRSTKALGVIFDQVAKQSIQFLPDWEHAFDQRILKRFELRNDMLKAARKIKTEYDTSVRRILSQHAVGTEFELYTAWAMSKPAIGNDYKRQEDLGHEFDALKQRFREKCYEAAGGQNSELIDKFVAAMYKVTEEEIKTALYEHHRGPLNEAGETVPARRLEARSMPLISFPWIFHWVMIRIALGRKYDPKKSMLANGRRKGNTSDPTTKSQSQAQRRTDSSDNKSDAKETVPSTPEKEISTKLPDGTIVHRGEPLLLFGMDDNGMDDSAASEARENDERNAFFAEWNSLQVAKTADEGEVLGEGVDGSREDKSSGEALDGELGFIHEDRASGEDAEMETATDRLAKLLGLDEE